MATEVSAVQPYIAEVIDTIKVQKIEVTATPAIDFKYRAVPRNAIVVMPLMLPRSRDLDFLPAGIVRMTNV